MNSDWKDFSGIAPTQMLKGNAPKMGFGMPPGKSYNFKRTGRRRYGSRSSSEKLAVTCAVLAVLVPLVVVLSYFLTWGALLLINWLLGFLGYTLPFELNWQTVAAVWGIMTVARIVWGNVSSSSSKS